MQQEDGVSFSRYFIVEPGARDISETALDGLIYRHRGVLPEKVISPLKA
jgi:hypothetical protein